MLIRLTTEMKDAFFAGCKARGVVLPAVPADEVEKPPVRPPQRPPAKEKEKTLVLLRYTIGK